MAAETEGYLIRGGRVYDHDGDIHQPAAADLLIRGGTIERMAPHKHPREVVFVESLPRTHLGKIDRGRLRQG